MRTTYEPQGDPNRPYVIREFDPITRKTKELRFVSLLSAHAHAREAASSGREVAREERAVRKTVPLRGGIG